MGIVGESPSKQRAARWIEPRRKWRPDQPGVGWGRLPVSPGHVRLFVRDGDLTEQHLFDLYRPYNPVARSLFRQQLRGRRFLPPADPELIDVLEAALHRVPGEVLAAVAMTSSGPGRVVLRVSTTAGEWFVKHGQCTDDRLRTEIRILDGIPARARTHFAWPPIVTEDEHVLTLVARRVSGHCGRALTMADCLDAVELLADIDLTHGDLNPQNVVVADTFLLIDLETARTPLEPWFDFAVLVGLGIAMRKWWSASQALRLLLESAPRLERYANRYDGGRDWRLGLGAALAAAPWDHDGERQAAAQLRQLLEADVAAPSRQAKPSWRLVPVESLDAATVERWHTLAEHAAAPNPSYEPEFLLPAVRHLPEAAGTKLLLVEQGAALLGVLPMRSSAELFRLRLPGTRNYWQPYGCLGEPLVAAGAERAVAEAALTAAAYAPGRSWLRLDLLDTDGPFARAVLAVASARGLAVAKHHSVSRAVAIRRPGPTYLTEGGRGSNLKKVQRRGRAFERTTGHPLSLVDRGGDKAAVETFLRMEAAGWKGADGGAYLARPGHGDFFREMTDRFRNSGRFQLLSFQTADAPVAMLCNVTAGDTVFWLKMTYDENLAAISPGLLMMSAAINHFHADPAYRLIDSCADWDNATINRLFPDRRPTATIVVGFGALGRCAMWILGSYKKLAVLGRQLEPRVRARLPRRGESVSPVAPPASTP